MIGTWLLRFLNATLPVLGWILSPAPAFSQAFSDTGFFVETLAALPRFQPVGMTWAPDGRMFIWQENGMVRVLKDGALLPTPFLDIGDHVNTANDRGLLGLALDPGFDRNGFIYLLYAFEPNSQPGDGGPKTTRLTRMQADFAHPDRVLAGSETILLGSLGAAPCSQYPAGSDCIGTDEDSHGGGTLRFAPDGKLFVSIGDGASYRYPDPLSFRAQDLDRYEGKILRINPDGSAPGDNPFDDGAQSIRSKVYAYGLRNPYRFGLDSLGEPYIGDVGTNRFEEVNRGRGANFGWPCMEGDGPNWFRVDYPGFERCRTLDTNRFTKPVYAYGRDLGHSVIGGSFNTGNRYPDSLAGDFFFADYATDQILRMKPDGQGRIASVQVFAVDAMGPVSLERGPDGYLYYIAFSLPGSAEVRRIGYAHSPPIAKVSASPQWGRTPLNVAFSSAGSSDPGGDALTYQWDFGDGSESTDANPDHVYTPANAGTFLAVLKVTNARGRTAQAQIEITLGSSPPTAAITRPAPGALFHHGDTLFFEGSASDSDQNLPAGAFSWQILLQHDRHVHPYATVSGPRGYVVAKDHGEGEYRYLIQLTVTDAVGLQATRVVETAIILPPVPTVPEPGGPTCSQADTSLDRLVAALPTGSEGMIAFGNGIGKRGVDVALIGRDYIPFIREVLGGNGPLKGYLESILKRLFVPEVAGMTLVDVDDDGDNDLIAGYKNGLVAVSYFSDCGGFSRFSPVLQGPNAAVYPVVADLDGDGIKDLLLNEGKRGLFAYRNTGSATAPVLGKAIRLTLPDKGVYFDGPVIWEDFNLDGLGDIAGFSKGRLRKYSGISGARRPRLANGSHVKVAGRLPGCPRCGLYFPKPGPGTPVPAVWRPGPQGLRIGTAPPPRRAWGF